MTIIETILALTVLTFTPGAGFYTVGVGTGSNHIGVDTCGLSVSKPKQEIVNWDALALWVGTPPGHYTNHWTTIPAGPDVPGKPDLLIRAFCENRFGRAYSLEVGCLDHNPADCVRQCGDMNADFKISLADFVIARKAASMGVNHPYCDTTDDQQCTLADFVQIRQAVASHTTEDLPKTCAGMNP